MNIPLDVFSYFCVYQVWFRIWHELLTKWSFIEIYKPIHRVKILAEGGFDREILQGLTYDKGKSAKN